MSDVLSVIFDRQDRSPSMHEYGEAIDRHLDRLAGGGDRLHRAGPPPRAPIVGFAAYVEVHETGPIFLLDPGDLPALAPLLDDVRDLARAWARRSPPGGPNTLQVRIGYGPRADPGDEYYAWKRFLVTTDPATVAARLDELIAFVVRMGTP